MLIKRMRASFGKLNNSELRLDGGLNIIEAPNESGKSTWCAFLCAMLYGIDPTERDSKTSLAAKNQFKPWSGAPMEGLIELEHQGVPITIERKSSGRTPMTKFSAYRTDTGEPVEGLTGDSCGQTLLGVERSVFQRSAFVHQSGVSIDKNDELERRLTALVTTGEDGVSYSEADDKLRSWLRARRYNKSGRIPEIDGEIEQLRRQERSFMDLDGMKQEITGRMEELEGQKAAVEAELRSITAEDHRESRGRLAEAAAEMDQRLSESVELESRISAFGSVRQDKLDTALGGLSAIDRLERELLVMRMGAEDGEELPEAPSSFDGLDAEQAWQKASEDMERCNDFIAHSKSNVSIFLGIALAVVLVGMLVISFNLLRKFFVLLVVLSVIALLAFAVVYIRHLNGAKKCELQAASLLLKYSASTPHGILEAAARYREIYAIRERMAQQDRDKQEQIALRKADVEEKRNALLLYIQDFMPEIKNLEEAGTRLEELKSLLSEREGVRQRLDASQKLYEGLLASAGEAAASYAEEEKLPPPTMTRDEALAALSRINGELSALSASHSMTLGEMKTFGSLPEIAAKCQELSTLKGQLEFEYSAVELAASALKKANSELRTRLSPQLNARASEIMSAFTGSRYDKLIMERDMTMSVSEADSILSRKALALSSGTIDQLYLAVRLALCDLLLPAEAAAPLILDDAFGRFDDKRLSYALDWVMEAAKRRQVIIFTCQAREKLYCQKK